MLGLYSVERLVATKQYADVPFGLTKLDSYGNVNVDVHVTTTLN